MCPILKPLLHNHFDCPVIRLTFPLGRFSLYTAILALGKARIRREPNLGCRGADTLGWCNALPETLHDSCRMDRRIDADSLICSLGHCQCDGHTVHKLSQRCLPAGLLDPRESDCSRMRSKVSSNWLPSYIIATRPILEIFKMAGYFPDRPRKCCNY